MFYGRAVRKCKIDHLLHAIVRGVVAVAAATAKLCLTAFRSHEFLPKNALTKCADHVRNFRLRDPTPQRTFDRDKGLLKGLTFAETPLSAISRFNWSPESPEARPLLKALVKMVPRSARIWSSQPK